MKNRNALVQPSFSSSPDREHPSAFTGRVADELRRLTHPAHVRINRHPLLVGLTLPGYPLERYRAILAVYGHLYEAIEAKIEAFLARSATPFDYSQRRKHPWLQEDAAALEIDVRHPRYRPQRPIALDDLVSTGQLIGVLYTIEGATQGGQVISRHLAATLNLTAGTGARFFNGYGDPMETHRRWQQFCAFADSILHLPDQRSAAGVSALGIFALIEEHLNDCHARLG